VNVPPSSALKEKKKKGKKKELPSIHHDVPNWHAGSDRIASAFRPIPETAAGNRPNWRICSAGIGQAFQAGPIPGSALTRGALTSPPGGWATIAPHCRKSRIDRGWPARLQECFRCAA